MEMSLRMLRLGQWSGRVLLGLPAPWPTNMPSTYKGARKQGEAGA